MTWGTAFISLAVFAALVVVWSLAGAVVCGIAVRMDFPSTDDPVDGALTFWLAGVLWPIGLLVMIAAAVFRVVRGLYMLVSGDA